MSRRNIPRPRHRCGACIVLHAQCPPRCFFAPYFSHEEGAIDFSAINRVFGVSNASLLLYRLLARDRSEAAVSLTIEALARLQDPVYGCPAPQPDQNPSWNFDLPIIPEDVHHPSFSEAALPPYPGEASSSQMPPPDDIDELGAVMFGNHRPH
ncbi:LOB domain-containing protein 29-like [Diospyros lotus]|uniref:LOB domain-containing protein 29-like n=1 Tax=Diospyros lotus TaxID=55363 RepID=UPI002252057F|nr:LOB domain-containing protein 29-like [Diospyros lotus]